MGKSQPNLDMKLSAALRDAPKPKRSMVGSRIPILLAGATILATGAWFAFPKMNDAARASGFQAETASNSAHTIEVATPSETPSRTSVPAVNPEALADYSNRLAEIDLELKSAAKTAREQGSTLTGNLAASRVEQLKLSKLMIENIVLAKTEGVSEEVVAPRIVPNPQNAAKLQREIDKLTDKLEQDLQEADRYSGGLVLALIVSRIETQKLQIAQLNAALIEAKYGFPMTIEGLSRSGESGDEQPVHSTVDSEHVSVERVPWADPDFPHIDYSERRFAELHSEGYSFSGWWAIQDTTAPIDDSRQVIAMNLSESEASFGGNKLLVVRCLEREPAVIYLPGDFLLLDYNTKQGAVSYRIDGGDTITANWNALTNNKGVGVFGLASARVMNAISTSSKTFIRVTEKQGQNHDAVFEMDGVAKAITMVREACKA